MKKLLQKTRIKKGFSLIELSVVIVIISILVSGAMSVVTSTQNESKIQVTHDHMQQIKRALEIYLRINKSLPCPAPITAVRATDANYGLASTTNNCATNGVYSSSDVSSPNIVYGMVPVQDLNLNMEVAEDGFGNKIAYALHFKFASDTTFDDQEGDIEVFESIDATTRTNTNKAAYVLISYGQNKAGSFAVNSGVQNSDTGGTYEAFNYAVPTSPTDLSAAYTKQFYSAAIDSDVFDDIIYYETRNNLVNASGAHDLIKCDAVNDELETDTTLHDWPETDYNHVAISTTECPSGWQETVESPTRRCGAYGVWEDDFTDPCTYSANNNTTTPPVTSDPVCTGGQIVDTTTIPGDSIHIFTSSGDLVCEDTGTLTYLVVGAGGSGGGTLASSDEGGGGGGGGGGVLSGTYVVPGGGETITITVGQGGAATTTGDGNAGTYSQFKNSSYRATGGSGGKEGGHELADSALGGASGSGNSSSNAGGGVYNDTDKDGDPNGHDGGGGGSSMAAQGVTPSDKHDGGDGAEGTTSNVTGVSIVYGSGGGGGAHDDDVVGEGGTGAGDGANEDDAATAATANRGSGGGGGNSKEERPSTAGSDGVVIIRYTGTGTVGGGGGGGASCSGGTISYYGGKTIHTFDTAGSYSLTCTASIVADYIVVGAGGGGGGSVVTDSDNGGGGGGGGGGVVTNSGVSIGVETISVTVGAGGSGSTGANNGVDGGDSIISGSSIPSSPVTATGGGGGLYGPDQDGNTSDGTASSGSINGGTGGVSGSGNSGSNLGGPVWDKGHNHSYGGGGSSMNAQAVMNTVDGDHDGGHGAVGTTSTITGVSVVYGSGGGGGAGQEGKGEIGLGGTDSGGDGADKDNAATAGVKGGGGGGGSEDDNSNGTGADGGDGIVIFSYPTP